MRTKRVHRATIARLERRHAFEYPCVKGTYNPVNGSNSDSDCLSCPPGEYCESKLLMIHCE